jgi:hypothetical protein
MSARKSSTYGRHVAELRARVKDARQKARDVRKHVARLIVTGKEKHRAWVADERARHRELLRATRATLRAHEVALRQSGRVEAHLLTQNAIDKLTAHRDEFLRLRLDRTRASAGEFRESEHGIAYIVEGHPELLELWRKERASIRRIIDQGRARGRKMDPPEVWNEYLHDHGGALGEARARLHLQDAKATELEIRDLTRQWKAGTLDESMGAACEHPRAVKSVDGRRRICPDCGRTLDAPKAKKATKKRRPRVTQAEMDRISAEMEERDTAQERAAKRERHTIRMNMAKARAGRKRGTAAPHMVSVPF